MLRFCRYLELFLVMIDWWGLFFVFFLLVLGVVFGGVCILFGWLEFGMVILILGIVVFVFDFDFFGVLGVDGCGGFFFGFLGVVGCGGVGIIFVILFGFFVDLFWVVWCKCFLVFLGWGLSVLVVLVVFYNVLVILFFDCFDLIMGLSLGLVFLIGLGGGFGILVGVFEGVGKVGDGVFVDDNGVVDGFLSCGWELDLGDFSLCFFIFVKNDGVVFWLDLFLVNGMFGIDCMLLGFFFGEGWLEFWGGGVILFCLVFGFIKGLGIRLWFMGFVGFIGGCLCFGGVCFWGGGCFGDIRVWGVGGRGFLGGCFGGLSVFWDFLNLVKVLGLVILLWDLGGMLELLLFLLVKFVVIEFWFLFFCVIWCSGCFCDVVELKFLDGDLLGGVWMMGGCWLWGVFGIFGEDKIDEGGGLVCGLVRLGFGGGVDGLVELDEFGGFGGGVELLGWCLLVLRMSFSFFWLKFISFGIFLLVYLL